MPLIIRLVARLLPQAAAEELQTIFCLLSKISAKKN